MYENLDKRIIIIPFNLLKLMGVKPSKYYIIDALNNGVFFKTRKKELAQELCNELYGKCKYTVITEGLPKTNRKITAR